MYKDIHLPSGRSGYSSNNLIRNDTNEQQYEQSESEHIEAYSSSRHNQRNQRENTNGDCQFYRGNKREMININNKVPLSNRSKQSKSSNLNSKMSNNNETSISQISNSKENN